MTRRFSELPRGLSHPLFYSALLTLALNDHVLKGSGLLPAGLTGKLSDFAGLLVAPVVLAAVLGAARRSTRWSAPLLVGAVFTAIKLDASAAHAVERAFAAIGMSARIWVDASDLWALGVLPIASRLTRPMLRTAETTTHAAVARTSSGWHRAAPRFGLALATCFCIASFGSDDEGSGTSGSGPQLVNDTEDDLIVSIASTEGAGGCRIYHPDRASVLTADAFSARRELRLAAGARVGLAQGNDNGECGAAWISLSDGSSVRVLWNDLQPLDEFVADDSEEREARRVLVRGQRNTYRFDIGSAIAELVVRDTLPEPTCVRRTVTDTVEYTSSAASPGFLELGTTMRDDDGCLIVEWNALQGEAQADAQRLCIPDWAFPFEAGETLSVVDTESAEGERRLRVTRYDGTRAKLELTIWNDAQELDDSQVVDVSAADCVGELSACGAYVRPAELELGGDEGTIVPGDDAELTDGSDELRLLVGTARDVAWANASCTGADARIGLRVSYLELRTD